MTTEIKEQDLDRLIEAGVITTPEKNLRCKIDSITRSLKNLEAKKIRLDFEIKRQKKSLVRKREELKKESKRTSAKISLKIESSGLAGQILHQDLPDLRRIDSRLLQESNQVLEA